VLRRLKVKDLFVTEAFLAARHEEVWAGGNVEPVVVAPDVMQAMSGTATPQGILAVVETPRARLADIGEPASLVLVLADVRDPGNAGTLVRSAAAAGADAVVFTGGSVDPYSPKTVRSSAAALFSLTVVTDAPFDEVGAAFRGRNMTIVGTDAAAGTAMYDCDLTRRVAVVLGNEAVGLSDEARAMTDELVAIPMPGDAESLNVGIAGSILLFEAVRQRRRL